MRKDHAEMFSQGITPPEYQRAYERAQLMHPKMAEAVQEAAAGFQDEINRLCLKLADDYEPPKATLTTATLPKVLKMLKPPPLTKEEQVQAQIEARNKRKQRVRRK